MLPLNECESFLVLENGSWKPAHLEQIEAGDIVRMYSPAGELFTSESLGTNMRVKYRPALELFTVAQIKASALQQLAKFDLQLSLILVDNFIKEYSTDERKSVLEMFLRELMPYIFPPIKEDALPLEFLQRVLEASYLLTGNTWQIFRHRVEERFGKLILDTEKHT